MLVWYLGRKGVLVYTLTLNMLPLAPVPAHKAHIWKRTECMGRTQRAHYTATSSSYACCSEAVETTTAVIFLNSWLQMRARLSFLQPKLCLPWRLSLTLCSSGKSFTLLTKYFSINNVRVAVLRTLFSRKDVHGKFPQFFNLASQISWRPSCRIFTVRTTALQNDRSEAFLPDGPRCASIFKCNVIPKCPHRWQKGVSQAIQRARDKYRWKANTYCTAQPSSFEPCCLQKIPNPVC